MLIINNFIIRRLPFTQSLLNRVTSIHSKRISFTMLQKQDIIAMLGASEETKIAALKKRAYEVKKAHTGEKVFYRGIVELSNLCAQNCYYCGIRAGNDAATRYMPGRGAVPFPRSLSVSARLADVSAPQRCAPVSACLNQIFVQQQTAEMCYTAVEMVFSLQPT